MEREDYLAKFNRMVNEYISPVHKVVSEDDPNAGAAPAPDATATDPNAMGGDPNAMAAPAQDATATDPNAMAAPAADGTDVTATDPMAVDPMAGDPNAMAAPAPDASADQGAVDPPIDGQEAEEGEEDDENEEEFDNIEHKQSKINKKLDKMSDKFEKLLDRLDAFDKSIADNNERIESLKAEMEKRNPTPIEKMSIRSAKSYPFSETPNEYWDDKEKTSNYSREDDNDGADEPQYQIKQSDVDGIKDWGNIAKSFDDERMGLRDLLGY